MKLSAALDFCKAQPNESVKVRFSATAGVFVRTALKQNIESACSFNDVRVEIREAKGLLESDFTFNMRGLGRDVARVLACFPEEQ